MYIFQAKTTPQHPIPCKIKLYSSSMAVASLCSVTVTVSVSFTSISTWVRRISAPPPPKQTKLGSNKVPLSSSHSMHKSSSGKRCSLEKQHQNNKIYNHNHNQTLLEHTNRQKRFLKKIHGQKKQLRPNAQLPSHLLHNPPQKSEPSSSPSITSATLQTQPPLLVWPLGISYPFVRAYGRGLGFSYPLMYSVGSWKDPTAPPPSPHETS